MRNSLRNLLLTATIGLSMPGAMAQSESFTGLSGNSYYVDYESGLVMQLHENEATIVSPTKVVDEEFKPIVAKLADLANEHSITHQALAIDSDNFQAWLKVWELQYDLYDKITDNFRNASLDILQQYYNLAEILEQILELQAANKPAKNYSPTKAPSTTFSFDIWEIISDLDYAEFMVNFTRDYLKDLEEEINEFGEKLEESGEEIDQINSQLNLIVESHFAYIENVLSWLYEYGEYASEETVYTIAQEVQENVDKIKWANENIPDNPAEYVDTWAEICLDYLKSTTDNSLETIDLLNKLTERVSTLYYNFSGVLFAGPAGDEAGLFYTILKDNGSLILPPIIYSEGNEYYVTAIDGNLFSGMPEGVTMKDLKLVLPSTIMSISDYAFAIDGIKEIFVYPTHVPSLDSNCFTEDTYTNAELYVRDNLVEDYKNASPWNKFQNILPESLASVNDITDIKPEVRIEGSTLIVNVPAGNIINVYTADGHTIYAGYNNQIALPSHGLYVVKAANITTKIMY